MATQVKLFSQELNEVRAHDIDHANRIFAYKHNHGWELKDNNFKLENGIIVRASEGTAAKAAKPRNTEHSDTPRG